MKGTRRGAHVFTIRLDNFMTQHRCAHPVCVTNRSNNQRLAIVMISRTHSTSEYRALQHYLHYSSRAQCQAFGDPQAAAEPAGAAARRRVCTMSVKRSETKPSKCLKSDRQTTAKPKATSASTKM
eukprot:6166969-Pleurochrysis_carterae.AAC.2